MACCREGVSRPDLRGSDLCDPKNLSDRDLLAALLGNNTSLNPTVLRDQNLAGDLLQQYGGLVGLAKNRSGFSHGADVRSFFPVVAAFEIACRLAKAKVPERQLLERPATVAKYLALRYGLPDQEMMGALFLDVRNRLVSEGEIFRGTLTGAMVEPRTILKRALLCSAVGVVLFHSHPSDDPTPSQEDLVFTKRMVEAGKLLGIRVLDHLILGVHDRWVSLGRLGFIDSDK